MMTAKIPEMIDQVKNLFFGFAFLNKDKWVNALIESKSNLHFAFISIKSPPWVYYSIKVAINQCEALYIANSVGIAYHQNEVLYIIIAKVFFDTR